MPFRYLNIQETLFQQPIPENRLHFIFTVYQEQFLYCTRILAGQPLAQIFIITVGAHGTDNAYIGLYLITGAIDGYFLSAPHKAATQGFRLTVTHYQNGVPGIVYIIGNMML